MKYLISHHTLVLGVVLPLTRQQIHLQIQMETVHLQSPSGTVLNASLVIYQTIGTMIQTDVNHALQANIMMLVKNDA